jgi:hypothetical protein
MAERDRAAVGIDVLGVLRMPSWRSVAMPCEAKASLSSITSKSLTFSPSRSTSFCVAGTGRFP